MPKPIPNQYVIIIHIEASDDVDVEKAAECAAERLENYLPNVVVHNIDVEPIVEECEHVHNHRLLTEQGLTPDINPHN